MASKKPSQSKIEKSIQRINEMEPLLNECQEALAGLEEALDRMDDARKGMIKLFSYYGSSAWRSDLELDEQGQLPEGLQRGVLSEDLVYDQIISARDAAFRMLELAEDILKNRI
ncbi:MAG: DUF4298 domain-containing protein [Clostridiales bacterium]|nr:DUF4298 domain-containing protein [Clostridiales bacterium]